MMSAAVQKQKMPIYVAIVEDDEEIRANLVRWISSKEDFRFLKGYGDAETALADLPRRKPEVVLMDINLPGADGVECVRQLKHLMPQVHFLMLTVYEDNDRLFQSLIAGASGYLLKRTPHEKILAAIEEVHSGGAPMTPEMARRVVQHFQQPQQSVSRLPKLSQRETEVLEQLATGFLYKEIQDKLHMSEGTLRTHIASIYEKLHVHTRTEAVLRYFNH